LNPQYFSMVIKYTNTTRLHVHILSSLRVLKISRVYDHFYSIINADGVILTNH